MVKKKQFPPPKKIGSPHPNTSKSSVTPSNSPTPQAIINGRSLIQLQKLSITVKMSQDTKLVKNYLKTQGRKVMSGPRRIYYI